MIKFFYFKNYYFFKNKKFLKNKKYNISCVSDNNFTHKKIVRQISKTKTKNEFNGKIDYDLFRKKNFYLYYFKFLVKNFFSYLYL